MNDWYSLPSTLAEIEELPTEVLLCKHIAKVLQADPGTIHLQAVQCPERLGFPVIVTGTRVKIPKQPFLKFMRGEIETENDKRAMQSQRSGMRQEEPYLP